MGAVAHRPSGKRLTDFLVDHRVRISVGVFWWVFLQNLVIGNVPARLAGLSTGRGAAAVAVILAGLALRSWAAGTLRKGQALTTWGPYRLCRHPLYLGSLLLMAGFCLLIPNYISLVVVLGPVCLIYALTMRREEGRLLSRYGPAWAAYADSVPRLLPVRWPGRLTGPWSRAQWTRSGEHRAVVATLFCLVVLELWHAYAGWLSVPW
jgi:protein-S-isoprenylcysteine O-methyltransferase Ste14